MILEVIREVNAGRYIINVDRENCRKICYIVAAAGM